MPGGNGRRLVGFSVLHRGMSAEPLIEGPVSPLRLLAAYLGTRAIGEAIQTERGRRTLWLEILVNDRLDLAPWQSEPAVQVAYRTACRWYTRYQRLMTFLGDRAPLPVDSGPIDDWDYRTFAEALALVYAHHRFCQTIIAGFFCEQYPATVVDTWMSLGLHSTYGYSSSCRKSCAVVSPRRYIEAPCSLLVREARCHSA